MAIDGAQTAAGTKLYIGGTDVLASESAWVEVGEVVDIQGDIGKVFEEITHNPLGTRATEIFKGSYVVRVGPIMLAQNMSNAGQTAVSAALETDDDYNWRITQNDADTTTSPDGDPTTHEFKAKVMSFPSQIGSVNSIVGRSLTLGVKSDSYTLTAAD